MPNKGKKSSKKSHRDQKMVKTANKKKESFKKSASHRKIIKQFCNGHVTCVFIASAEYLCEPLRKCLKDEDPYVRKTAAVCVAKLHDINASLVEDQGFLDLLRDLLSDSNPMVSGKIVLVWGFALFCWN